jgi:hypothetical protein
MCRLDVGGLLDLVDERAGAEAVQGAARHVEGLPGPHRKPAHDRVEVLREQGPVQCVPVHTGLHPHQGGGSRGRVEDVPRLGLAVGLALQPARGVVVGVQMDRKGAGAVDELGQHREARAAPPAPHEFVGVVLDEPAQRAAVQRAVRDPCSLAVHIADLPGLRDRAVGQAGTAQPFGEGPAAEDVLLDRGGQPQGIPVHGPSWLLMDSDRESQRMG